MRARLWFTCPQSRLPGLLDNGCIMDKNGTATPGQVRDLYHKVALKLEEVGTAWKEADTEVGIHNSRIWLPPPPPGRASHLSHLQHKYKQKVALKVAFLQRALLPTLCLHAPPLIVQEVQRVVGLADFNTLRTDLAGESISNWDTLWDDSGLQEEFEHLAELLRAEGECPTPQGKSPAKRRRIRSQAPRGWIFLNDASVKHSIPPSTLHGWVRKETYEWVKKDEDSGQVRVKESELRRVLRAKNLLSK